MTKKELWKAYVKRNPSFDGDGNITMSARGLRKMFDNTWEMAYEAGFNQESDDDERECPVEYPEMIRGNAEALNVFNTLFGKKF